MKKRRKWIQFGVVLLLFLSFSQWVWAAEKDEEALWEASGADTLWELLPQKTETVLRENGLTEINGEMILDLNTGDLLSFLWDGIRSQLAEPVRLLSSAIGVILLSALLGIFVDTVEEKSCHRAFSVVAVLSISGILLVPVLQTIQDAVEMMTGTGDFLLGFLPVYGGIMYASGKPISAFTYQSLLMGTVEVFHLLASHLLVPLSGMYLALCLVGATNSGIEINGLTRGIKQVLTWVLGLFLTVFVGILTVKSFVANATDTVSLRTGKYLVGSFLPIVGGAVGDTLSVLQSSLQVMKSAVGAFGILVVFITFLPGMLQILWMQLSLQIAKGVGEILQMGQINKLLESAGFVLSLMQSVLVCYGMMVIISVSFMMLLGAGSG